MGPVPNRLRRLAVGLLARVSMGALGISLGAIVACVPLAAPVNSPGYVLCNSDGCGDNVAIVIDNG